jgi:hypothetical protein
MLANASIQRATRRCRTTASRDWQLALVEHSNREWADLYERLNA